MSDGDRLIAVLRRVRRRLRLLRALDGAVLGAAAGLSLAIVIALTGGAPGAAWTGLVLAGLGGAALGSTLALVAGGRSDGLEGAAAALDRTRPDRNGDRARIAWALHDSSSPFARAAVADAAHRLTPVSAVQAAPVRRPRGLAALGGAAVAGLVLLGWPLLVPAMAPPGAPAADARGRERLRAELAEVRRAARAQEDGELEALAMELERWLEATSGRAVDRATDQSRQEQLAAIAARARQLADQGAEVAEVLARVAAALAPAQPRLAEAFARFDGAGVTAEARAAAAAASSPETRGALAEALARAAAAAQPGREETRRRRLDGLEPKAPPGQNAGEQPRTAPPSEPQRRLQRLERDLQDSADACARDPEACAANLGARAGNLAAPTRDAAQASARDRLARALEQLAERGGARGGGAGRQAAGQGQQGMPAPGAPGGGRSRSGASARAEVQPDVSAVLEGPAASAPGGGTADEAQATFESAARGVTAEGGQRGASGASTGTGTGEGEAAGGGGEGAGRGPAAAEGPRVELAIPEGAGPTRAEAIRAGSRLGFAQPGYAPVFRDYRAAAEDGLERAEVPPGRQQLVRRYFELIRPR